MINKILPKIKAITLKNDTRQELQNIMIKDGLIVATNAEHLIEVKTTMHKDNNPHFILDKHVNNNLSDQENYNLSAKENKDLTYPDYKQIMPDKEKPHVTIRVNATYLKNILALCAKDESIDITFFEDKKHAYNSNPLLLECEDGNLKGLIMPIKN